VRALHRLVHPHVFGGDTDGCVGAEPPYWTCSLCTYDNVKANAQCEVCNSKKPARKARQVTMQLWECPECTKLVAGHLKRCDICDFRREKA
jgi:hypothetical protein